MLDNEIIETLQTLFKAGCLIGDLARSTEELSEDEQNMLLCAYEGYLVGRGA